jgi:hypothetical protein
LDKKTIITCIKSSTVYIIYKLSIYFLLFNRLKQFIIIPSLTQTPLLYIFIGVRRNIHKDLQQCLVNRFNMVVKRAKYVLLDGCGTARLASSSVTEAIEKLAEKMSPTACQELVGCAKGCMEGVEGKELSSAGCRKFDECITGCSAKANKSRSSSRPSGPARRLQPEARPKDLEAR